MRTFAVTHLSILFSFLLFWVGHSFLAEHFVVQSRLRIYDYIFQQETFLPLELSEERLERIQEDYDLLQTYGHRLKEQKRETRWKHLFTSVSQWTLLWSLFSFFTAWWLLREREGALPAAWLLPLILLLDLQTSPSSPLPPWENEHLLFPHEDTLVATYRDQPLSGGIQQQKRELEKCWEDYLLDRWLQESVHLGKEREQQVKKAEFFFQAARLDVGSPLRKRDLLACLERPLPKKARSLLLLWQLGFCAILSIRAITARIPSRFHLAHLWRTSSDGPRFRQRPLNSSFHKDRLS